MKNSPDEARLALLSLEMAERIRICSGRDYKCEKSIQTYLSCGTAMDWFYSDEANVNNKYRAASLIMEIGNQEFRFELPPSQVCMYKIILCKLFEKVKTKNENLKVIESLHS